MKENIVITLLFVIVSLMVFGIYKQVTNETPNERVERINRMADEECSQYEIETARDCFAYWYSMIEDRD